MRETSQWKFEQIPIKNKEVRIFEVVIYQTQIGNSMTYHASSTSICSVLKKSKIFIFPQEKFQPYMHPKYNNCKYVSILPLQGTNIYSVINNEENMILWNIMHKANEGELV